LPCIQRGIRHCLQSHSALMSWNRAYPHAESRRPRNRYKSTANASYRQESETEAVAIATSGGVYTLINDLRQSHHPSIWLLRHHASCITNQPTPGTLHPEQTAFSDCKQFGDGKLCNVMRCKSMGWSPTLADNRDVPEHCYAAKQHLFHSIWGMQKGNVERGMLNQWPTLYWGVSLSSDKDTWQIEEGTCLSVT